MRLIGDGGSNVGFYIKCRRKTTKDTPFFVRMGGKLRRVLNNWVVDREEGLLESTFDRVETDIRGTSILDPE